MLFALLLATAAAAETPALIPEDAPASEAAPASDEVAPAATVVSPAPPAGLVAAPHTPAWYEDLTLNLFASVAYIQNLAWTRAGAWANVGRVFDRDAGSIKVDVVQLALQGEPEKLGEAGVRVDLVYGQTVPTVLGNGVAALQQAFGSYIAPCGNGLRFDVGSFQSGIGSETIEGVDHFNDTYSRSFLFGAVPRLLTGGRVTYAFGETFRLTALLVNGWLPNVLDTNFGKSYGLSAQLNPASSVSLSAHYFTGPERGQVDAWRHTMDAVLTLRAPLMVLTLEGVLGRELVAGDKTLAWQGGLAAVHFDPAEWFSLALRGEYFDNRDPVSLLVSDLKTRVWEVTVTPGFKFGDTLLRLEYRYDHAEANVFHRNGVDKPTQHTLAANWLFAF